MEKKLGSLTFQNVNKVSPGIRQPCGSLAFIIKGIFQAWGSSFQKRDTQGNRLIFLEP